MNTLNRLLTMVLRGKRDQFNTVLQEELKERAAVIMEAVYKAEAGGLLHPTTNKNVINENVLHLKLQDKNTIKLTETEKEQIFKLYESLNNDNKERMLKLLTESQESVNRVLNLARLNYKG